MIKVNHVISSRKRNVTKVIAMHGYDYKIKYALKIIWISEITKFIENQVEINIWYMAKWRNGYRAMFVDLMRCQTINSFLNNVF